MKNTKIIDLDEYRFKRDLEVERIVRETEQALRNARSSEEVDAIYADYVAATLKMGGIPRNFTALMRIRLTYRGDQQKTQNDQATG